MLIIILLDLQNDIKDKLDNKETLENEDILDSVHNVVVMIVT